MTDFEAIELLRSRGFTFTRGGEINPPDNRWPYHEKDDESEALNELCYEWDYCYPAQSIKSISREAL